MRVQSAKFLSSYKNKLRMLKHKSAYCIANSISQIVVILAVLFALTISSMALSSCALKRNTWNSGFNKIEKAEKLVKKNRRIPRALNLLNKAEHSNYGFCGNAWLDAFVRINDLRSEILILQNKNKEALAFLDSTTNWNWGSSTLNDSLRIALLINIHGEKKVKQAFLELQDSAFSISSLAISNKICFDLTSIGYQYCVFIDPFQFGLASGDVVTTKDILKYTVAAQYLKFD